MKRIYLKIIDEIAKKHSSSVIEAFTLFSAFILNGEKEFEEVVKKIFPLKELSQKEYDILKDFFELLKDGDYLYANKEEIINNLSYFYDEKSAQYLAMFFTPFISKEALESKNPDKIRASLSKYPKEIAEAMVKSLEMLSLVEKIENREILNEVINTIIIINSIMNVLGE